MNIPTTKSRGYRAPNYEVDHSSESDTDEEGRDEEEGGMDDENVSTSGRGHHRSAPPPGSLSSAPSWPKSYKASMDYQMFPTSAGESFSLFSPIARISATSPYKRSSLVSTPSSLKRSGLLSAPSSYQKSGPLPIPIAGDDSQVPLLSGKDEEDQQSLPPPDVARVPGKEFGSPEADHIYVSSKTVDVDKLREEYGSSFTQASLNGLNVLAGVGILSTPYSAREGGWLGLSLLFLMAIVCLYTGILLRRCLDSRPGATSYPDIGEAAFGSTGRLVISIILYVELYVCCVEFLIVEGDNLEALFPGVTLDIGGRHMDSLTLFCIVASLIILPTVWLRDLSLLSYLSAGGVVATWVVTFTVFWVGAVDGVGFTNRGSLLNVSGLPVSIGVYAFCYSGHTVFPNIYTSMKNPSDFNKVLILSFCEVTIIYSGIAIMGYLMFGDDLESSITLNLPPEFLASKIAVWTTIINPVTKFALSMTPVALSLEELLPNDFQSFKGRSISLAIRTSLVASTVLVAVLVPFFGYVMAFIGSLLSITVSVIVPCACYLKLGGVEMTKLQRNMCWIIIIIGIICAGAGTYSSVVAIIDSFGE